MSQCFCRDHKKIKKMLLGRSVEKWKSFSSNEYDTNIFNSFFVSFICVIHSLRTKNR